MDENLVKRAWDHITAEYPEVTSVDMGYKIKNGVRTGEIVIRVAVKRKHDKPTRPLPTIFEGVPIDVIEYKPETQCPKREPESEDPFEKRATIRPGMSVGDKHSHGTAGWMCVKSSTGQRGFVTNHHVLTDRMLHVPSRDEYGFIPPPYESYHGEYGDMAFIPTNRSISNIPLNSGVSLMRVFDHKIGMKVFKSGAKTGLTKGVITGSGYTISGGATIRSFTVEPLDDGAVWSSAGDSGSAVFDASGNILGLHFAGNIGGPEFGTACLATHVMSIMGLAMPDIRPTKTELAVSKAIGFLSGRIKNPAGRRFIEREWHKHNG